MLDFISAEKLSEMASVQVVLVDNGSTDETPRIAQGLVDQHAGLRYVRLSERGVGRALKASWTSSEADIVGYTDLGKVCTTPATARVER